MDWSKYFTPELITSYVIFFLGAFLSLIGFFFVRWLSRTKPQKVNLLKESESSLVEVSQQVKNEIVVTYKGKTANSLFLTTFSMWNGGQEVIDNIEVALDFQDTEVMEVVVDDSILDRAKGIKKTVSNNRLELSLPYLNPHKEYSDKVKIRVFALNPIAIKNISGGGRGWVVESIDHVQFISDITNEVASISSIQNITSPTQLALSIFKSYVKLIPTFLKFTTRLWL